MLAGSSPRVRGKQLGAAHRVAAPGLIPACAGKTPTSPPDRTRSWAHPRACGENDAAAEGAWVPVGSSPRVRGKLSGRLPAAASAGLIPARAGKTGHEEIMKIPGLWLIPARAGKTPHIISTRPPPRAHPRACGENATPCRSRARFAGSSPRVRGKRPHPRRRRGPVRLIPARAGKTAPASSASSSGSAHPRTCGENQRTLRYPRHQAGSSPRVRGKPRQGGKLV